MFAPNTIIENLLQRKYAQAALVLDALFAADINKWPMLDFLAISTYLRASGLDIGDSIVRRGLFDLSQIGLVKTEKILSRRKGRPQWKYRIKSVPEMASKLGVKLRQNEASDAIPLSSYRSIKAFRAGKHISFLKRLGRSELGRKKLGARLGVGGRSTFNYELNSGITVNQRVETTKLSYADIEAAPTMRLKQNIFLKIEYVRELSDAEFAEKYKEITLENHIFQRRTNTEKKYMPYTRYILRRELELGHDVYLCKQITNEYLA